MQLHVNGKMLSVKARTLAALLQELGYESDWLATAVNSELVPQNERMQHPLQDGDTVEILSPMQGG